MAVTSLHKETGRYLTSLGSMGAAYKEGDVVTLSISSKSNLTGKWSEFTQYTLTAPVAFNERGDPLFDLKLCSPVCAADVERDPIFAAMESDEVDPEGDRLLAMISGSIGRAQRGQ